MCHHSRHEWSRLARFVPSSLCALHDRDPVKEGFAFSCCSAIINFLDHPPLRGDKHPAALLLECRRTAAEVFVPPKETQIQKGRRCNFKGANFLRSNPSRQLSRRRPHCQEDIAKRLQKRWTRPLLLNLPLLKCIHHERDQERACGSRSAQYMMS